ncbi:hypothetical protein BMF94_5211 [Rhodotorula taiwanensis]|uniref:Peptidase S54 rhomboid domain-containing protein n=1 Tax=Rhodotorula taiwanensis TaxID=741276 RepID=A0A2S5B4Z5_9BASI|nr:hypothetical protein BMF94_5211 [Rhodotorula taiwanensis]
MLRPSIRRCFPRRGPGPAPGDKTRPAWIASPLRRAATGGVNPQPIPFRLTPQVAFATATIALSVGGAAWYTNQDTLERSTSSSSLFSSWSRSLSGASTPGLQPSLVRQRWEETYARAAAWVKAVGSDNRLAIILAENWVELSEAKRTCAGLIASFVGVWIAWRLPARMRVGEWLAHQPLSGRAVTLLTSTFSHRTITHLGFNSIALFSFSTAAFSALSHANSGLLPRSTSRYEFLALFATAGVVSALASHVWFSRVIAGGLLKRGLTTREVRGAILPSLGASGAVYALVTLTALSFPSTSVSLIFLPFFPIPIGVAASALVAVDIVGLLRGWRMFDHAAHLAGAAMGAAWFAGGHALFERLRAAMWDGQKRRLVEQRRLSRS